MDEISALKAKALNVVWAERRDQFSCGDALVAVTDAAGLRRPSLFEAPFVAKLCDDDPDRWARRSIKYPTLDAWYQTAKMFPPESRVPGVEYGAAANELSQVLRKFPALVPAQVMQAFSKYLAAIPEPRQRAEAKNFLKAIQAGEEHVIELLRGYEDPFAAPPAQPPAGEQGEETAGSIHDLEGNAKRGWAAFYQERGKRERLQAAHEEMQKDRDRLATANRVLERDLEISRRTGTRLTAERDESQQEVLKAKAGLRTLIDLMRWAQS